MDKLLHSFKFGSSGIQVYLSEYLYQLLLITALYLGWYFLHTDKIPSYQFIHLLVEVSE